MPVTTYLGIILNLRQDCQPGGTITITLTFDEAEAAIRAIRQFTRAYYYDERAMAARGVQHPEALMAVEKKISTTLPFILEEDLKPQDVVDDTYSAYLETLNRNPMP